MTGKQTILATLLLLLCFSLAACKDEGAQKGQMPAPPVGVFQVEAKDVPWPSEFQAQASGSRSVEVRARVQGIIEKRLYREGEFVKAGQLMFQIERDQYEAAVQQAEAQYDSAKREWNRVRPLFAKNAVSQKDRDNAKAPMTTPRLPCVPPRSIWTTARWWPPCPVTAPRKASRPATWSATTPC